MVVRVMLYVVNSNINKYSMNTVYVVRARYTCCYVRLLQPCILFVVCQCCELAQIDVYTWSAQCLVRS